MPVVVLVALATIDTCQVLYLKQSAKIAAYEGARVSLVAGVTAEDVVAECSRVLQSRRIEGFEVHLPESLDEEYGELLRIGVSVPADRNSLVTSWFYRGRIFTEQAVVMVEL